MKKIVVMLFIILIVGVGFLIIRNKKIVRPDMDYIATIYHSEMIGIDAGWQYIYYIYPDENESYVYIKSKSEITIAGASEEEDVDLGKIKDKNDFEKIEKDIEKAKLAEAQQFFNYTYKNEGKIENLNSMEELAEQLF